jgi:ABC-type multidrug transport system permease subunit
VNLIGIGLLGLIFISPNADPRQGAFFQAALQTTWRNVLDFAGVWSSIKIILFSVSLGLLIESVGTMLALLKFKSLALSVFFLQVVPVLGLLCGGFYFVKSLL